MRNLGIIALAAAIIALSASASAQTIVSANVVANTTWGPGEIVLQNPIFVIGATLTIQPGTIIRGQPRQGITPLSPSNYPGALIVTRTGRIIAIGNTLQPIIFTTAATDNNNDGIADTNVGNSFLREWTPGDLFLDDAPAAAPLAPINKAGFGNVRLWGGVVILGNAPTNLAARTGAYGEGTVEGLTAYGPAPVNASYGGLEPHDDSGTLRFVSIRHAGDEIVPNNELNGLSLGGVGDGTVLENIEIYCNHDDGIQWFGGTVNGKNLAAFFVGDDSFHMDQGYTGVNQFMFSIQPFFNTLEPSGAFGQASGDKVAELEGDDYRPDDAAFFDNLNIRNDVTQLIIDTTPWPLSSAVIYNLTAIGSTPDVPNPALPLGITAAAANRGLQMRNGFAGQVRNSIVVNTGTARGFELVVPVPPDEDGISGFNVADNATNGLISLYCSTLQNTAAISNPSAEQTAIDNGNNEFTTTSDNNTINLAGFNGLQNESTYFDPTGNAAGKLDATLKPVPINPRPNAGIIGTGGCVAPKGPGLSGATYRGAFERVAPVLWTTDWTALSIGGLLAD